MVPSAPMVVEKVDGFLDDKTIARPTIMLIARLRHTSSYG